MSATVLTVSNDRFKDSRARLVQSAQAHGLTSIHSIDFDNIKQDLFYQENLEIFNQARGMGFWLWKPYLISKTIRLLKPNDVLIYIDAGAEIVADLSPLIDLCREQEPVLLFGNSVDTNARWTKRDAFVLTGCDGDKFWNGPHCDASIALFCKSEATDAFLNEWLSFCSQAAIITDQPNSCGLPNLDAFQDHRHDQSVLSLTAQRNQISLHRIPSQYGNHYKTYGQRVEGEFNCSSQWDQSPLSYYAALPYHNSNYGQLINHHRTKAPQVETNNNEAMSVKVRVVNRLRKEKEKLTSRFKA